MDWHVITLTFADGRKWTCMVDSLGVAQATFSKWGRIAHFHGTPRTLTHERMTYQFGSMVERVIEW